MRGLYDILIPVLGAATVFLFAVTVPTVLRAPSRRFLERQERLGNEALRELFIRDRSARDVMLMAAGGAVVAALLVQVMTGSILVALIVGALALTAPSLVLGYLRRRRLEKFEELLPTALDQIAGSARAGLNLAQAIEEAARNAPKPVNEELAMVIHGYRLGSDLAEAIETTRRRIGSRGFDLVATALVVNREKGGNLPEALEMMSASLKEVWRLDQKVTTASAQGRKAVKTISLMPVGVFVGVSLFQPDMIDSLTGSVTGYVIMSLAVIVYAAGLWWLTRVLQVDV